MDHHLPLGLQRGRSGEGGDTPPDSGQLAGIQSKRLRKYRDDPVGHIRHLAGLIGGYVEFDVRRRVLIELGFSVDAFFDANPTISLDISRFIPANALRWENRLRHRARENWWRFAQQ